VNSLTLDSLATIAGPKPKRRAAFERRVASILADFDTIAARGAPADRALVQRLRAEMQPDLAATRPLFDALAAGIPCAGRLPRADVAQSARAVLADSAARHSEELHTRVEQRLADERSLFRFSLSGYATQLAVVVALALLLHRHRVRALRAAADAELDQLRRAALTDMMTDLPNFRSFVVALDAAAAHAATTNESATFAFLDVDEFTLFTESCRLELADQALLTIADVLHEHIPDAAFRVGHDRFALLRTADHSHASARLEALRAALAERLPMLTVRIGACSLSGPAAHAAMMRQEAEAALAAATRRGRNTIVVFGEASDLLGSPFTSAQTGAVCRAIATQRAEATFQPIYDLERDTLIAYEALARMPEDLGPLGPQEAFDIAEEIGHTHALDSACRAAVLRGAGALPPGVRLFINVAPSALVHRDFSPDALAAEVRAAGLDPGRVVIELTERADLPAATLAQHGARLRAADFGLALDDVGAGNAGLETLRRMPVNVIKIDRMVLASAVTDRASCAVLSAIVAFAAESRAEVVAEGIETAGELALVRDVARPAAPDARPRIHLVQGYLLERPAPMRPAGGAARAA